MLAAHGLHPPLVHMGNSAAVSARPDTWKTMVRPGILLYGYSLPIMRADSCPGTEDAADSGSHLEDARPDRKGCGRRTGGRLHGQLYHQGASRIAVLPVGYADGYPRLLSIVPA